MEKLRFRKAKKIAPSLITNKWQCQDLIPQVAWILALPGLSVVRG